MRQGSLGILIQADAPAGVDATLLCHQARLMKISAKPLKGETFEVDIEPDDKVEELKKRIAQAKSEFPVELQKLIYSGKILADGQAIKEYNIKPGEFVVVMVTKTKPANPPASQTQAAAPQLAGGAPQEPAAPPAAAPTQVAPAAVATAPALNEATVQQLCDMGFPRGDVERCLRAAFGNPDRAVEYLMSGVPAGIERDGVLPTAQGAAPGPTGAATGGADTGGLAFPAMPTGGGGGGASVAALEELRNHPRFEELAALVAENPEMLTQVLETLAQTNPNLAQAITENEEEFLAMLQDSMGVDDDDDDEHGDADMPPSVEISDAERQAVERLAGLGFDPGVALEAYLACDRNEELAANYLFDMGD